MPEAVLEAVMLDLLVSGASAGSLAREIGVGRGETLDALRRLLKNGSVRVIRGKWKTAKPPSPSPWIKPLSAIKAPEAETVTK